MTFLKKIAQKKQSGTTLIEMMAAVGILGVAIYGNTIRHMNLSKTFRHEKTLQSFNSIVSEVNSASSSLSTVIHSLMLSDNDELRVKCLKKSNTSDCENTLSVSSAKGFSLYRLNTEEMLTGKTANQAVYYDSAGRNCDANSGKCIAKAYTSIRTLCLIPTAGFCDVPFSFQVRYTVEPVFGAFWLSQKRMPEPITFETTMDTKLLSMLEYVEGEISCNGSRDVMFGLSATFQLLCTTYPIGITGDKGPKGFSPSSAPQGPRGPNRGCAAGTGHSIPTNDYGYEL